ncbi:7942_t:CDS:2, partial [Paraglomus occultum]
MSSPSASPSSSPVSTSSTLTEERSTRTMADVVKDFDTEELIEYLRKKDLKLKESHFKIFRKEEITGLDFLDMTKEEFRDIGFALGACYKTGKIYRGSRAKTKKLFVFTPVFEEIHDNDKAFNHCMDDIILKLSN